MDEITFDDKTYVSSKRAAQITGYAKDYVGQLCREGRVEARLVGRNWYILESSIREHRFGAEPAKPNPKDENGDWKAPSYAVESISELPTFDSEPAAPVMIQQEWVEQKPVEPLIDHTTTVKEMQDAWQDWFSRKEQEIPSQLAYQEDEIASEIVEQEPIEEVHVVKIQPEVPEFVSQAPVYTVPTFDMPRNSQPDQEIVPIHRSIPVQTVEEPQVARTSEAKAFYYQPPVYTDAASTYEPVYASPQPEGRILRERRVQKKKKPSVALQALFLSIAGIAIAVALIGSGEIDTFLSQNKIQYTPINFLGGENIVNNTK